MAPADSKDWLFAAVALTSAVSTPATAAPSDQAGVVTGVLSSTRAAPAGQTNAVTVVLGDVVRAGEVFNTGPDGTIHILFLDQSSLTLAPNSSLTIEKFSHDPQNHSGKIDLLLSKGGVRVVGGLNSKTNPTQVRTPEATVEISGGIAVVQAQPNQTQSTFLFGQSMTVTGNNGQTQTVTRAGFGTTTTGVGAPSEPVRVDPLAMFSQNQQFTATGTQAGGGGSNPQSAPPGPLISTGDRAGGQNSGSPSSIANDRLTASNSQLVGNTISNNRGDTINSSNDTTTLRNTLSNNINPNPTAVS